jgi:ABC-2 type transport system permease protein
MNFRGGIALIRKSLFSFMASRGFFWTLSISWMMGPLVFMFVWLAAAGNGSIGGYNKSDFTSYYLILILVNQLTYPTSHWVIGENIQLGTLSTWLMRPLPVIYEAVASDMALKIVCMPLVLALVVLLGIVLGFGTVLSWTATALFVPALLMACMLRFLLSYTIALFAFWTQKIDSLLNVNDTLVFLLAGQVAPTLLLPGILRNTSMCLPFRYMLGFPVELLTGKLAVQDVVTGLVIQAIWVFVAFILQKVVLSHGIKKYTAIGG